MDSSVILTEFDFLEREAKYLANTAHSPISPRINLPTRENAICLFSSLNEIARNFGSRTQLFRTTLDLSFDHEIELSKFKNALTEMSNKISNLLTEHNLHPHEY